MDKNHFFDQEASEANIKLNERLEDSEVHGSVDGMSEAAAANMKIQDAFYGEKEKGNDVLPTYMYNNTPAIKIDKNDD